MRSRLILIMAALWLATAMPAHSGEVMDRIAERGSVVAAAVPDTLPQAARTKSGKLEGFDIEVAEEIARRLKFEIKFVTPGWDTILAGGWDGKWDISVASITPTAERGRRLAFPANYRYDSAVLVVHKDNIEILQPADASGKIIGTKQDTTFEQYLRHKLNVIVAKERLKYLIDDPQIKLYPDKDVALAALAKGDGVELDGVVMSFAPARSAIAAGAPVRVIPGFLFFEPVAVAIDQGDPEFSRTIQKIVLGMADDGTLAALSKKWFGVDLTSGAFGPG